MKTTLTNRTILITGASRGLGKHLALEASRRGANIVAVARDELLLKDVEGQAEAPMGLKKKQWLNICGDVTEQGSSTNAISLALEQYGCIDMVIFNAGISLKDSHILNYDQIKQTFDVNFLSVVRWLDDILPVIRKSSCGRIVFISSLGRYYGIQNSNGYNSSKAALSNFAECLRADFHSNEVPVKVINVMPGFISTEMIKKNKFKSFVYSPEKAAIKFLNGIEKNKVEIKFPIIMYLFARIFSMLPAQMLIYITGRLLKNKANRNNLTV